MIKIARLTWDARPYEIGLDRGVFYPSTGPGEAWNGLVAVVEAPKETNTRSRYIDGVKRSFSERAGEFAGTIEAYSCPEGFFTDVLTQRRAENFGLTYRTGPETSYKIHIVYNVLVAPVSRLYQGQNVDTIRWSFTTKPVDIPGARRGSHLVIDTTVAYSWAVAQLEDVLYGTDDTPPSLPTPEEVFDIIEENSILQVTDHGDGSFTVDGPDSAIVMLDATSFEITWPSAIYLDAETYRISSL